MIDSTSFGSLTVKGRLYTSDLIIFPDGTVVENWWRIKGHLLQLDDLDTILRTNPELIVIGTGTHGRMRLHPGLAESIGDRGIDLLAEPTPRAIHTFNTKWSDKVFVAGGFHLTC
jgi:hypothetical protein